MRALLVLPLVLLAPLVVMEGCKDNPGAATDAAGSTSVSASASAVPPIFGVLSDDEVTDALKRKRVIAIVRVKSLSHDDPGTKNESIRYAIEVVKTLNGAPPTETIERGTTATMVVGKAYAVVIDRRYLRLLVRAVEVAEDKIPGIAAGIEVAIAKIAPIVAASASAFEDDDDVPPIASGSASGSVSANPSTSASGSASTKPSASVSAKPSASTTAKPPASMTAGTPKPPASATK
jgi:hypothetical protein